MRLLLPMLVSLFAAGTVPVDAPFLPEPKAAVREFTEVHGEAGTWMTFRCGFWSPCAEVIVETGPGGAHGYRTTLVSTMRGGFDVRAERLEQLTREEGQHIDRGGWNLGGYGFDAEGPVVFERKLPDGTANRWVFGFAPLSGEVGGTIRILVEWLGPDDEPREPWVPGEEPCFTDLDAPCWKDTAR